MFVVFIFWLLVGKPFELRIPEFLWWNGQTCWRTELEKGPMTKTITKPTLKRKIVPTSCCTCSLLPSSMTLHTSSKLVLGTPPSRSSIDDEVPCLSLPVFGSQEPGFLDFPLDPTNEMHPFPCIFFQR
ncbi:hypothetical protein BJ138DRAFT_1152534 [Hygrophoropsis aurantiaca]|uniref:Uncharacterized protein n=1 Tax=Hygrophoropsis aurantiaca TaxID=72124 RepID=A0ACB8AC27_9AGAM|nr:hypothetical protein BJ138DRAFT_1152534 [Hygrophoropsis aurantiaca]